jgi:hypothetical protein
MEQMMADGGAVRIPGSAGRSYTASEIAEAILAMSEVGGWVGRVAAPVPIAPPTEKPFLFSHAGKLRTLTYGGTLTPEERDVCLDGLVDVLLDIFLAMSLEQKARYRGPKE